MGRIFAVLLILSVLAAMITGNSGGLTEAALEASSRAVTLCIALCGGYAFWMGLIETARQTGFMERLARLLSPVLKKLFPQTDEEALCEIGTNLSANMLGMGNAATPSGLSAMKKMAVGARGEATRDMIMLVVINISSIQLLPTGVMAVLSQAGMQNVQRIVLPSLAATCVSTAVGVASVFLLERFFGKKA